MTTIATRPDAVQTPPRTLDERLDELETTVAEIRHIVEGLLARAGLVRS